MITEPTEPQDNPEEFWPNDEQKQDLLKLCEQITGESQTPSPLHRRHSNRGHPNGLRGFLTIAAAMAIALGLLSMGWFSSFYFFGVAEQAKELQIQAEKHKEEVRDMLAERTTLISDYMIDGRYYEAFILLDALATAEPSKDSRVARINAINQLHRELWGEHVDLSTMEVMVSQFEGSRSN